MGLQDIYYGIIDWLDDRGIPHFVFLLLILVILVLIAFFVVMPALSPEMYEVKITVKTENNLLVPGQPVQLMIGSQSLTSETNASGALKSFSVKPNEKIQVSVSRNGFDNFSKQFIADKKSKMIEIVLSKPKIPELTKINLMIAKENNESLSGTEVSIKLSCSNSTVVPSPSTMTTDQGQVSINVPAGCGVMKADVSAKNFQSVNGYTLRTGESIINLSEIEVPKGKVIVKVLDAEGLVIKEKFTIVLHDSENTERGSKDAVDGIAEFGNVEKTEYYATVTDSSGRFESARTDSKKLVGEYISLNATTKRQTKGFVQISVIDAASNLRVSSASVKITSKNGIVAAKFTTDNNSDKNVALFEYGTFTIQVGQEDYLAFEQDFNFSSQQTNAFTARLEKCLDSASNCGKLEATVLDEDSLPVENAEVSIYNADTQLLAPQNPAVTDVNGVAKFSNLKRGKYFLRAFKYPAEKKDSSNPFSIEPKIPAKQTVRMEIGEGILKVIVKDEEGLPIANARVEFKTESGKECPKPDGTACALETSPETGSADFAFKADKKVYATVSAEGYSSLVSSYYQILKSQTITINAVLKKTIPGGNPQFDIVGIYGLDGATRKNELKAGERYVVRLKLDIPASLNPQTAGFFIMTGGKEKGSILENDPVYQRNIFSPEITALKGTTWNPDNGSDIDSSPDSLTNSDFKWVNATFTSPKSNTTYLIDAEIKVRNDITPGTALLFNYRAWVGKDNGEIIRTPEDQRLGTALESGSVQSLYALTKEQPFYEGKPALCDDESGFCFYNDRVYDESERLNITGPYNLKVFQAYTMSFEISNISQTVYGTENNARFQFVNSEDEGSTTSDVLQILEYTFTNANGIPVSNSGFNAFKIPEIQIQDMRENKSVKMLLRFQPKKTGSSSFVVKLIARDAVVFTKEISFSVKSENQLSLEIIPDFFGAFTTNDFNAIVKDNKGFVLENATVKATKIAPDRTETLIGSKKTSRLGIASFTIPSSSPGTIIRIEAEKEDFAGAVEEIKIDENILEFDPDSLLASLNLKNRTSKEVTTIANNKVPIELYLSNARITGRFGGFLDEDLMNNYLAQLIGNYYIDPNSTKSLTMKAAVSPSAILEDEKEVNGQLHLEFSNDSLGKTWAFNLPFKANISVGPSVDDTGCINISLKDWQSMTQENLTTKEFTILNNCQVEGSNIPVQYLKARLTWIGNPIGNVQVTVTDPNTGASASEILRDGEWITLFDTLRPSEEAEYYSMISFAPTQGHLNEEAKFKVEFDASTPTTSGMKSVGASNPINANILVTTLTECVQFEPGSDTGVRIAKGEDEKTFTIDTSKCGESTKVQFRFCQNDAKNVNCRGGTKEGGIEVSPWSTTAVINTSKEITVRRQSMPGYYGITVEAKVPGRSWQKLIDFPVIVEPKETKAFYMDKYNFIMLGQGAKDSTTLYNRLLEESVKVKANMCAWGEASTDPNYLGYGAIGAGVGLIAGSMMFISTAATAAAATTAAAGWATFAVGLVTVCWICIIAVVIIAIVIAILMAFGFGGTDCADTFQTNSLNDYIINLSGTMDKTYDRYLPPDAQEIITTNDKIKASWNFDIRDTTDGVQSVGVVLENEGIVKPDPIYEILTVKATEHIHGDATHKGKASVNCGADGDFGNYYIKCEETTTIRSESFHIMVKTQETRQQLPKIQFDTLDCSSTSLLGRTGDGSLPKVKLDWSWTDGSGINYDTCDAENPNGVYCDATQLSIALSKRIKLLDDFYRANNYFENICPETNIDQSTQQTASYDGNSMASRIIDANSVYIKSIIKQQTTYNSTNQSNDVVVKTTIKNGTLTAATVQLNSQVRLMNGSATSATCTYLPTTMQPNSEITLDCPLSLSPAGYAVVSNLTDAGSGVKVDTNNVFLAMFILERIAEYNDFINQTDCEMLRTTDFSGGKSIIMRFIDTAGGFNAGVNPTTAITDKVSLEKMFSFDALLMRDAYTMDFRKDFVDYYVRESLADAPQFFKDDAQGFKKYFLDANRLKFTNKYFDSDKLGSAGRYKVNIAAVYNDDWRLFDGNNSPKAAMAITFYLIKEPTPNSPFYSMPLNGNIGLEGSSYNRQGYGVKFVNQDEVIVIDNSLTSAKTSPDAGSNSLGTVNTRFEDNLQNLNNDITRKGNLLSIQTSSNTEKSMEFSPNLATPTMMKITAKEKSTEPFGAFYTLMQGNTPQVVGNSLALWSAGGNCYDFSGLPLIQAFDEKPDRKANALDNVANWETLYTVDWQKIELSGDNYLRTIFYTPKSSQYSLRTMQPTSGFSLYTPDSDGSVVALNGISTMEKNNINNSIATVEDVFELVKQGKVCVTNTGVRTRFWWNPKTIFEQAGSKRSISGLSKSLVAGQNCIG